jgi:hypothetical protein
MGYQELFLEIYLFLLCINGGIMAVDALTDTPIISPFDIEQHCFTNGNFNATYTDQASCEAVGNIWDYSQVTAMEMPAIMEYDYATNSTITTNKLIGDVTVNVQNYNGTSNNVPLDMTVDSVFFPWAVTQNIVNFLTGGFVWQTLNMIGMPAIMVVILQSVIGLLLVRTIVYYATGR